MEGFNSGMKIFLTFSSFLFILFTSSICFANNLTIENVGLGTRNTESDTVIVEFDVSWDNSWRTKINHDAVWITIRLHDSDNTPINKKLCNISADGLNPSGSSVGTATDLEIFVPSDKKGAFLRPSVAKSGDVNADDVRLTIDYSSCGFTDTEDNIVASVIAFEMVYVPESSFYAGDYGTSTASFRQGSADTDPWYITSEALLSVTDSVSDSYYYVSAGNTGENATGSEFSVPANYPKGYASFYAMKYEINEEQWVAFSNSLDSAASRNARDLTNASHKNTDAVVSRNTISCVGSPAVCSTSRPARPVSFLTWMDFVAFLDWAALRPMTELEYEKLTRGPILPLASEYAWGTTSITAVDSISGSEENGEETVTTTNANAHYGSTVLSGGDSSNGVEYTLGPVRSGIFTTPNSNRESAGGGKYGALELSGNLSEWVVTVGNSSGLSYTGNHGDGYLTTATGFEGNANVNDWPGLDAQIVRGVTGAEGSGLRGGSWSDMAPRLRLSDRYQASYTTTSSSPSYGGRGVRTDDAE